MPCTPRQVSAGVPAEIDAVTCQALFQRPSRHGPALTTPAEFADALASVAPPVPLPVLPTPGVSRPAHGSRLPAGWVHEPVPGRHRHGIAPRRGGIPPAAG